MKLLFIYAACLAVVAMPAISTACHVTDVWGNADCNGWELCTTVYFNSSVDEGSLEYTVAIYDGNGDMIYNFGETLTISHDPGEGTYEYCFSGIWEGEYLVSGATVKLTSSLDGENPTCFTFDLECTVDTEDTSFGQLKARFH